MFIQRDTIPFWRKLHFGKGMLHRLEDSSILCRGIACWKHVLSHRITAKEQNMFLTTEIMFFFQENSLTWKKITLFEKECCIFKRTPAYFVGVLLVEKHCIISKENYRLMNNVSLQTVHCSMQYYMLEQECNMLSSCYIYNRNICPFKGRQYFFSRYPASFRA